MEPVGRGFTVDQAVRIAKEAHSGQEDKSGKPYIEHPLAVMNQLQGDIPRMTGALHDVAEDTDVTFEELSARGCPPEVIEALRLVTHPEGFQNTEEEYLAWIIVIRDSGNQTAIDVKWADLTHNSGPSRFKDPTGEDYDRQAKYLRSKEILKPFVSEYLLSQTK